MVIKSLGFVVKLCGSKFWFSLLAAVLFWESLFNLSVPQFSHLEIGANNNITADMEKTTCCTTPSTEVSGTSKSMEQSVA